MKHILGVIFCGGKATRLGGVSKMAINIGPQNLLDHAAAHLSGSVSQIALSIRKDTTIPPALKPQINRYKIIYDETEQSVAHALLSALKYAQDEGYDAILTLPVDTPFLPKNYAQAMIETTRDMDCVYAQYDGRIQGLHSLWKTHSYDELFHEVINKKTYKISNLYKETLSTSYIFTDVGKAMFLNINTPETLALAQQIAAYH